MFKFNIVCLLVLNSFITNALAYNTLRELNYAEAIKKDLDSGEIVWLEAKRGKFLAIYTETEKLTNLGTAIILHSMEGSPDQQKIINPLRTYLPKHNWATLSLQMPLIAPGSSASEYIPLFDDARARIQSAVDFLVSEGIQKIVLIGYGMGGMSSVYYIKESKETTKIDAIVTISLGASKKDLKQGEIIKFFSKVTLPFLDIFAEFDLPEVINSAKKRKVLAKKSRSYRQFQIEGEGYLFQHDEGLLVKRVYSWINRTFKER